MQPFEPFDGFELQGFDIFNQMALIQDDELQVDGVEYGIVLLDQGVTSDEDNRLL